MKQAIGLALVVSPFVGLFGMAAHTYGLLPTIAVFGASAALMVVIYVGAVLLTD